MTAPSQFEAPFLHLFQDADSLCEGEHIQSFLEDYVQRQRHFRLIAGTRGCIDRVGGSGENWLVIQRYGRHVASLQSRRELQWEKCLNICVEARNRLDGHLA